MVVVGALKDAATPVHWSEALADQLVAARLVIADTDVHSVVHRNAVRRALRTEDQAVAAVRLLRAGMPTGSSASNGMTA